MKHIMRTFKAFTIMFAVAALMSGVLQTKCQALSCNESDQDLILLPGETYQLTMDNPEQTTSVVYTSSDTNVASVSETGLITVLNSGTVTIHIYSIDTEGWTYSDEVYVYAPAISADSLDINLYDMTADEDGSYAVGDAISFSYLPDEVSVYAVSSDAGLTATYSDSSWGSYMDLQILKTGNYTLTIYVSDKTFTVNINVRNLYFKRNKKTAGDISWGTSAEDTLSWHEGYSMLALYKGETATLKLKGVLSGEQVTWTSSNKSVAKVSGEGVVTAKSVGYATITATVGAFSLTYDVGVSYKTAIKALRYDIKNYWSTYSQPNRMAEGYYDCSSFVWRAYKSAGTYLNKNGGWAPTAAGLAEWCVKNNYMIYEGNVDVSKLLPGDLVFECDSTESNGRYKGIYHVDMFQGNGKLITVAREKYSYGVLYDVMVARPCVTVPKLNAKKSGKAIKLSWTSVYGATGYKVYRSTSKNGSYQLIATVKDATEYKDTTAKKGKTYYYKVRAFWKGSSHTYKGKLSAAVKKKR